MPHDLTPCGVILVSKELTPGILGKASALRTLLCLLCLHTNHFSRGLQLQVNSFPYDLLLHYSPEALDTGSQRFTMVPPQYVLESPTGELGAKASSVLAHSTST